jgi:hypothetical protein
MPLHKASIEDSIFLVPTSFNPKVNTQPPLGDNLMLEFGLLMIIVGIELINVELYNRSKQQKHRDEITHP